MLVSRRAKLFKPLCNWFIHWVTDPFLHQFYGSVTLNQFEITLPGLKQTMSEKLRTFLILKDIIGWILCIGGVALRRFCDQQGYPVSFPAKVSLTVFFCWKYLVSNEGLIPPSWEKGKSHKNWSIYIFLPATSTCWVPNIQSAPLSDLEKFRTMKRNKYDTEIIKKKIKI